MDWYSRICFSLEHSTSTALIYAYYFRFFVFYVRGKNLPRNSIVFFEKSSFLLSIEMFAFNSLWLFVFHFYFRIFSSNDRNVCTCTHEKLSLSISLCRSRKETPHRQINQQLSSKTILRQRTSNYNVFFGNSFYICRQPHKICVFLIRLLLGFG